jgi:hypothetical protein
MAQGPGIVSPTKHVIIGQAATANHSGIGNVAEGASCFIQGTDTRTGTVFRRAFGSTAALQQWLSTDPSVHFYDFSAGTVGPSGTF